MLETVLMPKSFKTNIGDSEYIERVVEVKKIKNHYLFKFPTHFIPGGTRNLWHIAKQADRVSYKFFRTQKQAIEYLKEVLP